MQSSRPSGLRGLLATALGAFAAVGAPLGVRFAAAAMQSREEKQARIAARARSHISTRPAGRRYPEQSSRQAMRGHRRAQGGRGLTLDTGINTWVPRPDGVDGEVLQLLF